MHPSVVPEEPAKVDQHSERQEERVEKHGKEMEEPVTPGKAVEKAVEEPTTSATTPLKESAKEEVEGKKDQNQVASDADGKLFTVEEHHDTEEVIERLLDVKGLEESVSGLWGWMSGGASKVAEQASKVAEKATQHAAVLSEKATQHAAVLSEKATKAKTLAAQQAQELAASVSKTMEDKPVIEAPKTPAPVAALPWETAHPERRAEARERVLKLSMDDHTFTVPPPKEAAFVYDAAAREAYAARMLDTDALLSAKRFKLVPKTVDEFDFWKNYFYRVDLILNAMGVPPPSAQKEKTETPTKPVEHPNNENPANADWEEEMRKQMAAAETSDVVKEDENFDMLDDDLMFEDDGEIEKSIKELELS